MLCRACGPNWTLWPKSVKHLWEMFVFLWTFLNTRLILNPDWSLNHVSRVLHMCICESQQVIISLSDKPWYPTSCRLVNNWWNKVHWLWAIAPRSRAFSPLNYSGKRCHCKQETVLLTHSVEACGITYLLHSDRLPDTSQQILPLSRVCCLRATVTAVYICEKPVWGDKVSPWLAWRETLNQKACETTLSLMQSKVQWKCWNFLSTISTAAIWLNHIKHHHDDFGSSELIKLKIINEKSHSQFLMWSSYAIDMCFFSTSY